jgi:hypothetical protein
MHINASDAVNHRDSLLAVSILLSMFFRFVNPNFCGLDGLIRDRGHNPQKNAVFSNTAVIVLRDEDQI